MTQNPQAIISGVFQFDVKTGHIDANLKSVEIGIARLAENGAQLTVLPELWSCGFDTPRKLIEHAEKTPQIIENIGILARNHRMIIAGSLPEQTGDCIYNTMVVIDKNGSVVGKYRKTHLFSYIEEDKAFSAGNRAVVCDTSCGPVGLMICYDLRFPELCRSLALGGARIIIVAAQWPESRIRHWDTLLQARAIENQVFVAAANRVGADGDLLFNGHSQIISPDGSVLARITDRTDGAAASVNFNEVDAMRNRFNCLTARRPSVYHI